MVSFVLFWGFCDVIGNRSGWIALRTPVLRRVGFILILFCHVCRIAWWTPVLRREGCFILSWFCNIWWIAWWTPVLRRVGFILIWFCHVCRIAWRTPVLRRVGFVLIWFCDIGRIAWWTPVLSRECFIFVWFCHVCRIAWRTPVIRREGGFILIWFCNVCRITWWTPILRRECFILIWFCHVCRIAWWTPIIRRVGFILICFCDIGRIAWRTLVLRRESFILRWFCNIWRIAWWTPVLRREGFVLIWCNCYVWRDLRFCIVWKTLVKVSERNFCGLCNTWNLGNESSWDVSRTLVWNWECWGNCWILSKCGSCLHNAWIRWKYLRKTNRLSSLLIQVLSGILCFGNLESVKRRRLNWRLRNLRILVNLILSINFLKCSLGWFLTQFDVRQIWWRNFFQNTVSILICKNSCKFVQSEENSDGWNIFKHLLN